MEYLIFVLAKWTGDKGVALWVFIGLVAVATFALGAALIALTAAVLDPVRGRARALVGGGGEAERSSAWGRIGAALRPWVLPKAASRAQAVRVRLIHAGFRTDAALSNYYAIRALLMFGLPLVVLLAMTVARAAGNLVLMGGAAAVLAGALLPERWLRWRIEKRKRVLFAAMPDALDLLVVCTEAGYGLKPAIQRVADELQESHPELAAELGMVNAEMRAGVDRVEALRHLAERTNLEDIGGLVALLAQSLRFGTSVADALRIYADEFRDKRTQRAEETAATLSTRMVFPLVLCMFPAFFLVAIGPAVVGVMGALGHS
jgi:tight adherence protein C